MRALPITPVLLGLLVPGCPSSSPAPHDSGADGGNPKMLWLASDMDELHIKLTGSEPPPF